MGIKHVLPQNKYTKNQTLSQNMCFAEKHHAKIIKFTEETGVFIAFQVQLFNKIKY